MLTRILVLVMSVTIGALALEMVFGVHLGISGWMHRVFDAGHTMGFMPL